MTRKQNRREAKVHTETGLPHVDGPMEQTPNLPEDAVEVTPEPEQIDGGPVVTPEGEPAPAAFAAFSLCECGCGVPVRRRFLPGHDARKAAADALMARATANGVTITEQVALDAKAKAEAARAKGRARREREAAAYAEAVEAAKAVAAETPEQTAEALAKEATAA